MGYRYYLALYADEFEQLPILIHLFHEIILEQKSPIKVRLLL